MSNDKDKLAEYYESAEANQDSRSDAWVAFIIIVVFVVTAVFWVSGQVIYSDKNFSASSAAIQPKPAEVIACL